LSVYQDSSGAMALTWHIQLGGALSDARRALAGDGIVVEATGNDILVTATRPAALHADWMPSLGECLHAP
jgi:hypothetical protein